MTEQHDLNDIPKFKKTRNRYFAKKMQLLTIDPEKLDFWFFVKWVSSQDWWNEFLQDKTTSSFTDYFLDVEKFVDDVYQFLSKRDPDQSKNLPLSSPVSSRCDLGTDGKCY